MLATVTASKLSGGTTHMVLQMACLPMPNASVSCLTACRAVWLWVAALCAPQMGEEGPWAGQGVIRQLAVS